MVKVFLSLVCFFFLKVVHLFIKNKKKCGVFFYSKSMCQQLNTTTELSETDPVGYATNKLHLFVSIKSEIFLQIHLWFHRGEHF